MRTAFGVVGIFDLKELCDRCGFAENPAGVKDERHRDGRGSGVTRRARRLRRERNEIYGNNQYCFIATQRIPEG